MIDDNGLKDHQTSALTTFKDVEAAAITIRDYCLYTPLLESPYINHLIGGRLLLKAESLQVTGSFKIRGAVARMGNLTPEQRLSGVVARSSGNHGVAVAYCASLLNSTAVVVAPDTAPRSKIERIRALAARVVLAPPNETAIRAASIARSEGRIFVSPADDRWVVAGAGTVGLEIVRQAADAGAALDALLVCCSGGGLTAGCVLAFDELLPGVPVYGVEPFGLEKMQRSIAAGHRVDNPPGLRSICDALAGPYTAEIPFEILKGRLAGTLAVSDDEVRDAMRVAFSEYGLAVEPGGAAALAAVLSGRYDVRGRVVAVTISGRNVDLDLAASIIA